SLSANFNGGVYAAPGNVHSFLARHLQTEALQSHGNNLQLCSSFLLADHCGREQSCADAPVFPWLTRVPCSCGTVLETSCRAVEAVGATPDETLRRDFTRYFEMIDEANSRFNLTGAKGWERVRDELFIRSMRFASPALGGNVPASGWLSGRKVLDIGTGAGIP